MKAQYYDRLTSMIIAQYDNDRYDDDRLRSDSAIW